MPYILILILSLFTILFRLETGLTYYDLQRFFLLLFLAASAISYVKDSGNYITFSGPLAAFGSIFTIGIISGFINGQPSAGLAEVLHLSMLVLAAMVLSAGLKEEKISDFIYKFSYLFVSVYIIYFFLGYVSHLSNPFSPLWPSKNLFTVNGYTGIIFSDTLLFSYIRFFNHIQTWTIPLLISGVLLASNRINKTALFSLLAIWWALLIQSGGRGTLISVAVALTAIILLIPVNRKQRVITAVVSLFSGALLYLLMFFTISDPARSITRDGMSGRLEMWEKAWLMFLESPVFGKGPLSYSFIENSKLYFAHPHNFYLQILAEWGVVVFLILIIMICYALFKLFQRIKIEGGDKQAEMKIGITFSFIAALLHAGLSQIFHTPLSQVFLILMMAWLFNYLSGPNLSLKIKNSHVAIMTLVMISIFLALNGSNIRNSFKGYSNYFDKYETNEFFPRIWSQGLNENNINK